MNKVLLEIWNFINKNFVVIAALVVFFFWHTGCGTKVYVPQNTPDTTHNTVQVPQPIVIMPQYPPQQHGNTVFPINIPPQYNPSQDLAKLTEQYNELVKQFLATKTYKDSIQLKDTAGNRVGVVDLTQVVSENTLKSTQPTYQLSFPHTTTTITNTIYPKPKNQVYVGIGVESLINSPNFKQVDLGFMLKNKKDNVIGLSGFYDLQQKEPGIRVSYYQKIKLK